MAEESAGSGQLETATLAGGCFWCTEAVFQDLRGVKSVVSGYTGGSTANPSYEAVCSGRTGHAESVQVTFDPSEISFTDLLRVFFTLHDPTTLNRQGADVGTQYRSAVFYHSSEQERAARLVMEEFRTVWRDPIVTQIAPAAEFYPAEEIHHSYFKRNPRQGYCQMVIEPKVAKLREKFRDKLAR